MDQFNHLMFACSVFEALKSGEFPPRISPILASGLGNPYHQIYSPLPHVTAAAYAVLGDIMIGYSAAVVLLLAIAIAFSFKLGKYLTGSEACAALAVFIFAGSAYLDVTGNILGTYPEYFSFCLLPAALYWDLRALSLKSLTNWALAALFTVALMLSHHITSFYFLCFYALLFLISGVLIAARDFREIHGHGPLYRRGERCRGTRWKSRKAICMAGLSPQGGRIRLGNGRGRAPEPVLPCAGAPLRRSGDEEGCSSGNAHLDLIRANAVLCRPEPDRRPLALSGAVQLYGMEVPGRDARFRRPCGLRLALREGRRLMGSGLRRHILDYPSCHRLAWRLFQAAAEIRRHSAVPVQVSEPFHAGRVCFRGVGLKAALQGALTAAYGGAQYVRSRHDLPLPRPVRAVPLPPIRRPAGRKCSRGKRHNALAGT
ncbi:MAG: glycosyltransferase family 39 protein [Deltaproteobacteria bacterium]|nr:glycosyltransferase family 39 protein [Deltaproteobacteria bacterium]